MAVGLHLHHRRLVLHADLSHCSARGAAERMVEVRRHASRRRQPYCVLWDLTGTPLTPGLARRCREEHARLVASGLVVGSAALGVSAMGRVLGRTLRGSVYWADNIDDALGWLTGPARWCLTAA